MSTITRTWIAGLALAACALVLSLSSGPLGIASRAPLALLILFVHAWIVAVGERSCVHHGGVALKRFPIAPRLMATHPGSFPQLMIMVALLGAVTHSWTVALVAFATVCVLTIDLLRRLAPWILPVAGGLHALVTMNEFHTLGDLVETAKGWMLGLVWFGLVAGVFAGPLLRTDASPPYRPSGRLVVLVSGLFTYAGSVWLVTGTTLFTNPKLMVVGQDFHALALVILMGGVVQTLVMGSMAKHTDLEERDPKQVPLVHGHRVGQALMPLLMPLVAVLLFEHFPLDATSSARAGGPAWSGTMMLLMIVPLVPAAMVVARGLDRADGTRSGALAGKLAWVAFGAWFVLGPDALRLFYEPGGPSEALRQRFGLGAPPLPLASSDTSSTRLLLFGLPAADLCRSVTLMLLCTSTLSARLLRRAPSGGKAVGWKLLGCMLAVQVGGSWVLMPRIGPAGAPLAAAAAALTLLGWALVAKLAREGVEPTPQLACEALAAAEAELVAQAEASAAVTGPRVN